MRVAIFILFQCLLPGQGHDPTADPRFHSRKWTERRAAFEELAGSDGKSIDRVVSRSAELALVGLLKREIDRMTTANGAREGTLGEGYSEYMGWLADAVMQIADRSPDIPGIWDALAAMAEGAAESAYTRRLVAHGDKVSPFWLAVARKDNPAYQRSDALLILAQIVAYERNTPATRHLGDAEKTEIDALVRAGLLDRDPLVRYEAAKALAVMGTAGDIRVLERIATEDPYFITDGGQSGKELRFLLRENAQRAAESLRARLAREGVPVR